jgi:thiol-disulfide isomerase/thioredoxin
LKLSSGIAATLLGSTVIAQTQRTGIILIGASWCSVCKKAAPMLARYAELRGLPVLVASADLRPIAPFPGFVDPRGHPLAQGVERFPTTLVYAAGDDANPSGIVGTLEGYGSPHNFISRLDALVRQSEGS